MIFRKRWAWGFFLSFVILGFLGISSAFSENRLSIALFPFTPRDGEKAFLGYLLRDLLKRGLEKYVEVYDVVLGDNVVRESQLFWDTVLVPLTAQSLGRKIGCAYIVTGTFRYRVVGGRERIVVSPRLLKVQDGSYTDIPSMVFAWEEIGDSVASLLQSIGSLLGISIPSESVSLPFPLEDLVPLYEGVVVMDEAIRTYGGNQYPDRPLWQKAFALAQETIRRQPGYPEAYYYLASMYRTTRWWAKEVEAWEQYLGKLRELYGASALPVAQAYLRMASFCLSQKRLDEALSYAERAAELVPSWAEVYLLWGRAWYEKGDAEKARSFFERALEIDPHFKEARYFAELAEKACLFGKEAYEAYLRGYQSFTAKNFRQAAVYFEEATRFNPQMKEAYYWLGRALYEAGNLEGSEQAWVKLLELDPLHSQGQRFLERVRQEQRYGREAVRSFEEGYRLYGEGRYEEAVPYFERAVALSPFFSEAHDYLARCYYRMGKREAYIGEREKAVASLSEARERAWQYYEMGFELFGWGEKRKAREMLERAVQNDPSLGKAHLLLGEIYTEEKAWLEAFEHYEEASRHTEEEEKGRALWGMATSLYALARYGDVAPLIERIVREYPYATFIEEAEALWIEILAREKKVEGVEKAFQQFLIRFPQSPFLERAMFWYAFALYEGKKWERVKPLLEAFLARYPRSEFSPKVMEMLGYTCRFLGLEDEAEKYFAHLGGEEGEFLVADSLYRKRDWQEAEKALRTYLAKYPQGKFADEAALKLASIYLERGSVEVAEETIQGREASLGKLFPRDFFRLRARILSQKEDWEGVIQSLGQLEGGVEGLEREYVLLLALAYERLGREEEAREVLKKAGESPEEILGRPFERKLGEILEAMDEGQYDVALKQLEALQGTELVPEEEQQVAFLLGKSCYFLGRFGEARRYFEESLGASQVFRQEALFYLVDIAYREGAWNDVIQWASLLEKERGERAAVSFRVAVAQYHLGNLQESVTILENLKGQGEWDEQVRSLLLEELYALKDYEGFLKEAEEFLSRYPENSRVQDIMALSAWSAFFLGMGERVKSLVAAYVERFPQGTRKGEMLVLLVNVLLEEEDFAEALRVLQDLETQGVPTKDLLSLWYKAGNLLLRDERFEEAAGFFRKIFEYGESEFLTRAGYRLGICLEYLERPEEALSVYTVVAQEGESDEWVHRARERIEVLTHETSE